MSDFKSGFIALVGRPNSGKSTLANALVGEKIAIVSPKPQTTRQKVLGILNGEGFQAVFIDTPGIHRARTRLGERMNRSAAGSLNEVDAVVLVADATRAALDGEERLIAGLKAGKTPAILALNKVDKVKKESLLPLIDAYSKAHEFSAIIPISALKGDGVDILLSQIKKFLKEGPRYFPEEMVTDQPERQMAAEIIREKLIRLLNEEVPHGVGIYINEMKTAGETAHIDAVIYCERTSHKGIIIGKNGEALKKAGILAREDIEKLLGKKAHLKLWVKVKADWKNNEFMLKSLGYDQ